MGQAMRFVGHDPQARVSADVAHRCFAHVKGMPVPKALHALQFVPGYVCPQAARIIRAAVQDAKDHGYTEDQLSVGAAIIGEGEDVIRVRRQAHGIANWIHTKTTELSVELIAGSGAEETT